MGSEMCIRDRVYTRGGRIGCQRINCEGGQVMSSHLQDLSAAGVSIWLDDLSRDRLQSGSLAALISGSSVVGVTTNPSIFSAAIKGSALYKDDVLALKAKGESVASIVTTLTTSDVKAACDLFLDTFNTSGHVDGRVSIEVDPFLAHETVATIEQGKSCLLYTSPSPRDS